MPRPRVPRGQFLLGVVVVVLGMLTVAQGFAYNHALRRIVACQSAYSTGFADALEARTNASNQAQQAMDTLIRSIGDNLSSPNRTDRDSQVQKAISDYLAKRAEADAQRQAHPFPPPPRDICK